MNLLGFQTEGGAEGLQMQPLAKKNGGAGVGREAERPT